MSQKILAAVIFDMDGVLIDSEPSWQAAEFNVLSQLGLTISLEEMVQTTGLRIDQVVEFWYQRQPWDNYDNQATADAIVDKVAADILTNGKAMKGVIQALDTCKNRGLKIGLATSSSSPLIDAVMQKLDIRAYFDAICSAESLTFGKPHPEVYLNCAQALDIPPTSCLAIEDSFNGLIAARAANMRSAVIPAPHEAKQPRWAAANCQLSDLTELESYLALI
ncbi:hexitol phosphatase HxpB [Shewanella psychrotolerans]|uniref:hexitol phosphatase HxpB n=1 Tax=Shewanella psychrotolerans TaxID=2864206 RepID=UPI001C65E5A4|nr:hexitol phosphatase HxpB [Shewanella psychrotolerans]QYK01096.1 hexitol phosphatase HxpB [Shewanella psychrotolerans]